MSFDRRLQPEIMDGQLDLSLHRQALAGLARIQRWSRTVPLLWGLLRAHAGDVSHLRLLDLACGRGDLLLALWRRACRAGVGVEGLGLDRSQAAVQEATDHAAYHEAPLRFACADVVNQPLPEGYDVILCSLFLHHLGEPEAMMLLAAMRAAAGKMVVVNDLARSRRGYLLAVLGTRLITRSPVVHIDGPRSVRAALKPAEAQALARAAGWRRPAIRRHWPQRYLLWEAVS